MSRTAWVYGLLRSVKAVSRCFYRYDIAWIGELPPQPWRKIKLVALLNHTSFYEPIFVGWFPNAFLRRIATHGMIPVAAEALQRPILGIFLNLVVGNVVPITRLKDLSWLNVINQIHSNSMVIIMPEGRMMRKNGLDKNGKPMTVRGGIADLIEKIPNGIILMAYSGGLHHIQAPGDLIPRIFKTVKMRLECIDIQKYRDKILFHSGDDGFKSAVIKDLERRRDLFCPIRPAIQKARHPAQTLVSPQRLN